MCVFTVVIGVSVIIARVFCDWDQLGVFCLASLHLLLVQEWLAEPD